MNKTIYIPDEIAVEIQVESELKDVSFSKILINAYNASGKGTGNVPKEIPDSPPNDYTVQLDRIESKLDAHIAKNDSGNSSQLTQGRFGGGGRKIKKEKIETVKNMMGRSGAIPKGGKK